VFNILGPAAAREHQGSFEQDASKTMADEYDGPIGCIGQFTLCAELGNEAVGIR